MAGEWVAEFYEDEHGKSPMVDWLDDLSDIKYAALSAAIKHKLEVYGIELAETAWLKPLGEGLYELRVRHTEDEIIRMHTDAGRDTPTKATSEKILLRAFLTFHGKRICLLFGGYDKGVDPSEKRQQKEIARARKLKKEWEAKVAREKKAARRKK